MSPIRHEAGGDRHVDAGDGQQPTHLRAVQRALCDGAIELLQILAEPVEFTDMPVDGRPLVVRQRLERQPVPSVAIEQVGVRTLRDQVAVKDGMHLVLDPGEMAHDLTAPRHQAMHAFGRRIRCPDLGQEARGMQARQSARVHLVRLHMGMGDRARHCPRTMYGWLPRDEGVGVFGNWSGAAMYSASRLRLARAP
ncbi:hypothetical protein LV780_06415 [Cereibacter azotoformans]|uniref:hypothetical protein n=1 Tax=Cereibacter azotoformans TaxID=43057 RepID=UPI001960C43A|nr:hypothetical protein [Cereibacter azotoformans]MBO4168767.1 hypothetical protein [Cereibacter azotoformans]UIJ31806.1 hypothetical protein LV780_06415 [Cereibacter azotoformans]